MMFGGTGDIFHVCPAAVRNVLRWLLRMTDHDNCGFFINEGLFSKDEI